MLSKAAGNKDLCCFYHLLVFLTVSVFKIYIDAQDLVCAKQPVLHWTVSLDLFCTFSFEIGS